VVDSKGYYMSDGSEYNTRQRGPKEKMVARLTIDLVAREVSVLKKPISPETGNKK
jgi:hypothetical protein